LRKLKVTDLRLENAGAKNASFPPRRRLEENRFLRVRRVIFRHPRKNAKYSSRGPFFPQRDKPLKTRHTSTEKALFSGKIAFF